MPQRDHVARARRIDARGREPVGTSAVATGQVSRRRIGAQSGGGGDHLHQRGRGIGARRREALRVGRGVGEHSAARGIQHDHMAERHAAMLEHPEDVPRELRIQAVLDAQRAASALVIHHFEEALGPVRRLAGARGRKRERRARHRQPRAEHDRRLGDHFPDGGLRRSGSRGGLGGRLELAALGRGRRDVRKRCALEAARADDGGQPDAAGHPRQHAAGQRGERGAPADREPTAATLIATPAAGQRSADPDLPISPVHATTSSSLAPPRPGERAAAPARLVAGRFRRARSPSLHRATTPWTSGISSRRRVSMPCLSVAVELGQPLHDPCM